ncbi:MAG: ribose-phosphate diphosphokinase [Candidatus Diapherotrites archaeon]
MAEFRLFSGSAHPELANEISLRLGLKISPSEIHRFLDGEFKIRLLDEVKGKTCFVLQPTSKPAAENLLELLMYIDALKRAKAKKIVAVMPWFGFARQDWISKPGEPVTAELAAKMIEAAGCDAVLALDLHSEKIKKFFKKIDVLELSAMPLLVEYLNGKHFNGLVIVAPDAGSAKKVKKLAKELHAGIAIIEKHRPRENVSEVKGFSGEVSGKTVLMLDDMIDTAGTITTSAEAVKERGAKEVYVAATHGVLSGPAIERIHRSPIKEVIVTNSLPIEAGKRISQLKILSVAGILAEGIQKLAGKK